MAYGIQVRSSTGALIIDITSRLSGFAATGAVTLSSGQTINIPVTGVRNTDSWILITGPSPANAAFTFSKSYDYITITSDPANVGSIDVTYWVLRS